MASRSRLRRVVRRERRLDLAAPDVRGRQIPRDHADDCLRTASAFDIRAALAGEIIDEVLDAVGGWEVEATAAGLEADFVRAMGARLAEEGRLLRTAG